jgi:hypothetical protein
MLNAVVNVDSEMGSTVVTTIFLLFALGGVYLIVFGIMALVEASTKGGNNTVAGAWSKIVMGCLLFVLSSILVTSSETIFGAGVSVGSLGTEASSSGTTTCSASSASSSGGLTACAFQNLKAMVPGSIHLAFVIAFVAGVIFIGNAFWEMAHEWNSQRNNRRVHWGKIIFGTVLANIPWAVNAIELTLGISSGVVATTGFSADSSYLAYAPPSTSVINDLGGNISGLISSSLNIFAFFGVVAFIRGVFVLIKLTDIQGARDASVWKAGAFMLGGTCLMNLGWTLPAVGNMLFGSGNGIL